MRLRKNSDFSRVYKKGKSISDKNLVMYYLPNDLNSTRIGCSISKKVGNSVVRHRVKRLIKEVFRLYHMDKFPSHDLVFVARTRASGANFHEINDSISKLIARVI